MKPKASERRSQRIMSFKQWCELNGFSKSTGRRIIEEGRVRVTRLSARRIGIGELDNADFQAACGEGGSE